MSQLEERVQSRSVLKTVACGTTLFFALYGSGVALRAYQLYRSPAGKARVNFGAAVYDVGKDLYEDETFKAGFRTYVGIKRYADPSFEKKMARVEDELHNMERTRREFDEQIEQIWWPF